MEYAYFDLEEKLEKRRFIKSLIPNFLWMLYKRCTYRRRFPHAFVSATSKIATGAVIGERCILRNTTMGPTVRIGTFTTTGTGCVFYGKGQITIGKFCSIAPECLVWSENHNFKLISTYPFEMLLKGREEKYTEYCGEDITIGHDVWIGQRCIILAGAHIGNGCIVAAGSVVPRGIYPPYSYIAGVPGKVIKSRFSSDKIAKMESLQWWNKPEDEIFGMMDLLHCTADELPT